jgi:siroheme synthase (precorrin-2 oxidase/ferrochelatase)
VIYTIEGDLTPTSQQEEETRIATLAHALKKLGNPEDAAEFMRCLNAICEEGDARYRQVAAS